MNTQSVKEAIKSREIKKITDAQIVEKGLKLGEETTTVFIECYNGNPGVSSFSISTCFDSVRLKEIEDIKVISVSDSLNFSNLGNKELELIDAYKYNFAHEQPPINNLQDLKNGKLLFTYPVYQNGSDKKLFENLKTGTKPEDFAIIFIYFNKKHVILNM